MESNSFDKDKSLILKENNKRLRFLSEDEIEKFLLECPDYLRNIVECVLNSTNYLRTKKEQIREMLTYSFYLSFWWS